MILLKKNFFKKTPKFYDFIKKKFFQKNAEILTFFYNFVNYKN